MEHGFIKVAATTTDVKVANCEYNSNEIINEIKRVQSLGIKILVFPELSVTSYTCADMFFQQELICAAEAALLKIVESTAGLDILVAVGVPVLHECKLYNCAAIINNGEILAFVPKTYLPNHGEFSEKRYFDKAKEENSTIKFNGKEYLFGTNLIFCCENIANLKLAVEICEDVWAPSSPSSKHCLAGATVILNLSASNELADKDNYRKMLIKSQSAKAICAYIFADAGEGESTTDAVFAAHNMIFENGTLLSESKLFENKAAVSEIDVDKICVLRQNSTSFYCKQDKRYQYIPFKLKMEETKITRHVSNMPFLPEKDNSNFYKTILSIQAHGLKKRVMHTNSQKIVIGVSGGLDSTLALLVAKHTIQLLNRNFDDISAITMPCFGTSDRTKSNAQKLCDSLGIKLKEIDISDSVLQHFKDISHKETKHDVVFENAQARMRTLVLMDIANKESGLVLGTGDLSELALGWATYGGDHISMYNVNASVAKTLIQALLEFIAKNCSNKKLSETLLDILQTPISPELLPHENGKLSQKTESLLGPYKLHDFFLYHLVKFGFTPDKIYRLACYAFRKEFKKDEVLKYMKVFYSRFFSQQFKRSCMPDGPKVSSISLSPRGDFKMPSDCDCELWRNCLEEL